MAVVEEDLKEPMAERVLKSKKDDGFLRGQNLHLEIQRHMRKTAIIRKIAEHIIDNYIFKEEILNRLGGEMRELTPTQLEVEKAKSNEQMEIEKNG